MTNWEFKLQKEGDLAWLPLESPTVEIIEGRYQLIAQVGCANEPVEVTIQHQYDLDGVWQETCQQQVYAANDEGATGAVAPHLYGEWPLDDPLRSTPSCFLGV